MHRMIDQEIQLNNQHLQEIRRRAEQYQLADDAAKEKGTPIYAPALAQIGDKLVEMGQTLQARYGEFTHVEVSIPTTDPDCQPGMV